MDNQEEFWEFIQTEGSDIVKNHILYYPDDYAKSYKETMEKANEFLKSTEYHPFNTYEQENLQLDIELQKWSKLSKQAANAEKTLRELKSLANFWDIPLENCIKMEHERKKRLLLVLKVKIQLEKQKFLESKDTETQLIIALLKVIFGPNCAEMDWGNFLNVQ